MSEDHATGLLEFLFEPHDQFDDVERIRTQILERRWIVAESLAIDAQCLGGDVEDAPANVSVVLR